MFWHKLWFEPDTGRLRCWWRALAFLVIACCASLLLTIILALPLLSSIRDLHHIPKVAQQALLALTLPMVVVSFAMVGMWAVRTLDGLPAYTLGLSFRGPWFRTLVIALGGGIALIGIMLVAVSVTGHVHWQWHALSSRQWQEVLANLVSLLIFAVGVEIIYHGYLFQTLLRGIGPVAALLLVAGLGVLEVAFNGTHPSPIAIANVVVLFVLSGMLYLRTGTLWAAIGLNAGWNFALLCCDLPISGVRASLSTPITVALRLPSWLSGGGYGPEGGAAVSALLLAALALVTYARSGLSLTSCWWHWRHLLARRRQPPVWDFAIGSRHYQWKLLAHDPAE